MEGHLARGGPITAVFWTRPNPCESTVCAIWPPHVIASVLVRVHVCKCVWPSKVSLTQLVPRLSSRYYNNIWADFPSVGTHFTGELALLLNHLMPRPVNLPYDLSVLNLPSCASIKGPQSVNSSALPTCQRLFITHSQTWFD